MRPEVSEYLKLIERLARLHTRIVSLGERAGRKFNAHPVVKSTVGVNTVNIGWALEEGTLGSRVTPHAKKSKTGWWRIGDEPRLREKNPLDALFSEGVAVLWRESDVAERIREILLAEKVIRKSKTDLNFLAGGLFRSGSIAHGKRGESRPATVFQIPGTGYYIRLSDLDYHYPDCFHYSRAEADSRGRLPKTPADMLEMRENSPSLADARRILLHWNQIHDSLL